MSLVIEKIVNTTKEIPIMLDGNLKRLGDLGEGRYETIVKSLNDEKDIYLGEKTRQGIGIHLFHMGIFNEDSLRLFGYEINVKSLKQEPNKREIDGQEMKGRLSEGNHLVSSRVLPWQ